MQSAEKSADFLLEECYNTLWRRKMDSLKNIVLLIDADNTQVLKIESVIREISTFGRIVVKRAYGNWKKWV